MSNAEIVIPQAFEVPGTRASRPLTTVIRPRRGWQAVDLDELWKYRELLFFLALASWCATRGRMHKIGG